MLMVLANEANEANANGRVDRDARDICVFEMPKHNCCAYKCSNPGSNSEQKQIQTEKYLELASQNR